MDFFGGAADEEVDRLRELIKEFSDSEDPLWEAETALNEEHYHAKENNMTIEKYRYGLEHGFKEGEIIEG